MKAVANVRLFIALDLPGEARAALARWRDGAVRGSDELRPVADEALHVTLAFLGWLPEDQVERIWRTASGSLAGLRGPRLTATGFKAVPPRRPRLLAVDLQDADGTAASLFASLAAGLEAAGLYERERRPFWPHVTVARVRARARVRRLDAPPPPARPFTAREVTLYRSDLHPAGARYVALERLELGDPSA